MKTATQTLSESLRIDLRRQRVIPLIHAIMEKARPYLKDERDLRRLYDDLDELLHEAGAEIITDEQRARAGLPPRGPDGWTDQELHTLEVHRLEVMTRPIFAPANMLGDIVNIQRDYPVKAPR